MGKGDKRTLTLAAFTLDVTTRYTMINNETTI